MFTRFFALLLFASISSMASAAPFDEHLGPVFYASACEQAIASDRPTSAFCPGSAPQRTLPAQALHDGSSFQIRAGGRYTVSDYDKGAFAVAIKVGGAILTTSMPELLAVENRPFDLRVECIVIGSSQLRCDGMLTLLTPRPGTPDIVPVQGVLKIGPDASNEVDLVASSSRASSLTFEDVVLDAKLSR